MDFVYNFFCSVKFVGRINIQSLSDIVKYFTNNHKCVIKLISNLLYFEKLSYFFFNKKFKTVKNEG